MSQRNGSTHREMHTHSNPRHSGPKRRSRPCQPACAFEIMDSGKWSGAGAPHNRLCVGANEQQAGAGSKASLHRERSQYQNAGFPNAILWGEGGEAPWIKCNRRLWPTSEAMKPKTRSCGNTSCPGSSHLTHNLISGRSRQSQPLRGCGW